MQEETQEGVEEIKVAVDQELHQTEDQNNTPKKSAEYNFSEMRRGFNELKSQLEAEKKEKEEIRKQLDSFKSGFKRAFDPDSNEDESGDELLTKRDFLNLVEKDRIKREIEDVPKLYPDYFEVVKFVEPLVKENPALLDAIQNSKNPRLAAYQIVKNSYAYRSTIQKQDGKEVEKNLSKPIPSESIAGGSGIDMSERPMTLNEKAEVWKMARMYARRA